MTSEASLWQQKEINHRLTRTFLTEKLVAMKTGELKKVDRLCHVSLSGDFLSETFTVGRVGSQEKKSEEKKKETWRGVLFTNCRQRNYY